MPLFETSTAPTIAVCCRACAHQRSVTRGITGGLDPAECPLCGDLGWMEAAPQIDPEPETARARRAAPALQW
jgi:hypothetical protein